MQKLWCIHANRSSRFLVMLMTKKLASRGLPKLIQNVNRSSHGHSTPSLKISCKSVQLFSRNVADKEISIAASRGFSELTQNVIRSSHGQSTPSLKISRKSVQPFSLDTKRHRRQTDRQTTCCTKGATDSTVGQKRTTTASLSKFLMLYVHCMADLSCG